VVTYDSTVNGTNGIPEPAEYELPEGRLALAGVKLSRRLENGQGIWRLELPLSSGEPFVVEQAGGPVTPPKEVRRAIPAFLRGDGPHVVGPGDEPLDDARDDAIGRLRKMLQAQYGELLRHDPAVRLDLDPEAAHGMRVAARRARAMLGAARPILDPTWSEPLRDELKWLGASLGRRRDLDVLVDRLQRQIDQLDQPERTAAAELLDLLAEERQTAQAIAVDALSSERYLSLLDQLEAATRGPRVRRGKVSLRKLARREFKRLRKTADGLGADPSDDDLHRARIAGKRARYTAELAEAEVGKPARKFVERAKAFQDVLGEHQDAIVAEARLRGLLAEASTSGAAFAAGRLVEAERLRRRETRAGLPRAWRKLKRAGKKAWT
jgi:CHAD domain-containing protein